MSLAPICLFTYNRLEETKQTIYALQNNLLAPESDLFIFSDGPKNESAKTKIDAVRDYIKTVDGFKSVTVIESEENKGLANSIVSGVTQLTNQFGKAIVLEDDLQTSKYFLKYMNDALTYYEDNEKVMQVSAFMFPINDSHLPDTFFYQANTCWGWATWKRAWDNYTDDTNYIFEELKRNKISWKKFNSMQGFAFQMQLIRNRKNKLKTWAVKWHAVIKILDGEVVHPKTSLVNNIGLNGTGSNSKKEEMDIQLSDTIDLDVTTALTENGSDSHLLALKRLKKYFKKRFSVISILKRKFNI